jgi:catechol 2,3-dioxygenase-like lactoylglutathione lyase family enzyme
MIDHVSVRVQDLEKALAFYRVALAPVGYDVLMEFPDTVGLGAGGKPDLWLSKTDKPVNPVHVSFACDRMRVDAFHRAALEAGGTDNGPPGVRADYHPNYYAAFVLDPEGNNLEAVCHVDPNAVVATPSAMRARPARKAAPRKAAARKPAKKPVAKKAVA